MTDVNIFALGGLDENGKNCYVFEYNNKIYIINSGTKIPINSTNGIDTLIPNFDYLVKHRNQIQGIFITDVKNESFSALPWLLMRLPKIPIYTSKFNKILILDRLSKYNLPGKSVNINVLNKATKIGDLFVEPLPLAGSMPGHIGIDFITPEGDYLFMFNFIEDDLGIYGRSIFNEMAKKHFAKRKIKMLVVDSGRVNYNGKAADKIKLPKTIEEVFKRAKNNERIIVGAYDEEMYAISQILDLAKKYDRPIITYGKTYGQILEIIRKAHPSLDLPKIIDYKQANKTENAVVIVTGTTERLHSRFIRITDNNDVYLKLKSTDQVILIAPAINGLESLEALALDEIARITPKITDMTNTEFYRHRPAREDLIKLVNVLKPQHIIPAQGLYRYLLDASKYISEECHIDPKHIYVLQNGQVVHLRNGKVISYRGKVKEVGDIIVDGFGIGDISGEVIAEREILGREGVVIVATRFNQKTKLITGKIQINFVGSIDKEEKKDATELIKSTLLKIIETKKFSTLRDLQNECRKTLRKKIYKSFRKEPIVVVSFIQSQN